MCALNQGCCLDINPIFSANSWVLSPRSVAFDLGEHLAVAFPSEPKQFLAFGEFAKSSHTYRNGNVCFSVRLLTENPERFYLLLCIQKGVSSSLLLNNPELGE